MKTIDISVGSNIFDACKLADPRNHHAAEAVVAHWKRLARK
jgi:hypothetical protein